MLVFGGDNSGGGGANDDAWLLALRGALTWVPIDVGVTRPAHAVAPRTDTTRRARVSW